MWMGEIESAHAYVCVQAHLLIALALPIPFLRPPLALPGGRFQTQAVGRVEESLLVLDRQVKLLAGQGGGREVGPAAAVVAAPPIITAR